MPTAEGPSPSYTVHGSGAIMAELRKLQRRATRQGRGEEFLAAVRQAHEQLQRDPTNFGEPLYRLPVLRMGVYQAVIRPLVVNYAVSEERPQVFLKGVWLLSKGPS